jgi:sec-independent protein translocase protein TatC
MPFWEHLAELRTRLMRAVIGVLAATVAAVAITNPVLRFLLAPMGESRPVALHPTESFVVFFQVSLLLGVTLAMPWILFQMLGYFVPALERKERWILYLSVVGIGLFFAGGVAFAGLVMVPLSVGYLSQFNADIVQNTYSISNYVSFVTTLLFSVGLVFETPLVLALLARIGVVNAGMLAKGRRYAVVVFAIVAGIITPTPDPFNMMLVMIPLLVLYEVGIILAWFTGRAHRNALRTAGMEA